MSASARLTRHVPRRGGHRCPLPGMWKRWRENIGVGSVMECTGGCWRQWVLTSDTTGTYWTHHYATGSKP
jgi:hypothetical protein